MPSRAYTVCKCGSWVFTDRIGEGKLEFCRSCGQRWPGIPKAPRRAELPEARVWKQGALARRVQPTGPRQEGKIHKALHSLWDKFSPEVQQGLVAAGWRPQSGSTVESPPGLPRVAAGGHLGKGKGKGKQIDPSEQESAHQALWDSASQEQRLWLNRLGLQDPSPAEPSDLKTLVKAHMDQLPESLQQAIASLDPPAPEPTATQQVLNATKKFKSSTNELRQLVQKSAALQVRIDRAKAAYAELLDNMKSVQADLSEKQLEVTKLQKDLESKIQSGAAMPSLPGKDAVLLALTQCGITLSSEQQALLEGSMEVDQVSASGQQGAAPQPAAPPSDWPDGTREAPEGARDTKHRSRSRGRAQG